MTNNQPWKLSSYVLQALVIGLLLDLALPLPAPAGEAGKVRSLREVQQEGKTIRLSMRIAQAKKKDGSRRYFQSLARRQRALCHPFENRRDR